MMLYIWLAYDLFVQKLMTVVGHSPLKICGCHMIYLSIKLYLFMLYLFMKSQCLFTLLCGCHMIMHMPISLLVLMLYFFLFMQLNYVDALFVHDALYVAAI
ncbi:hypothetical protein S245_060205 [Arachis hypogaea]